MGWGAPVQGGGVGHNWWQLALLASTPRVCLSSSSCAGVLCLLEDRPSFVSPGGPPQLRVSWRAAPVPCAMEGRPGVPRNTLASVDPAVTFLVASAVPTLMFLVGRQEAPVEGEGVLFVFLVVCWCSVFPGGLPQLRVSWRAAPVPCALEGRASFVSPGVPSLFLVCSAALEGCPRVLRVPRILCVPPSPCK
ncbi:hypothetical protein D4764_11G0010230 [Takifugu flavidus]|uniref:Uncharacterized protein n=1 Tax=Takifugu flavidus TaxID=433684 RepID=A0A5C6PGL0_9TELE|nr:hypothetical protein D4764_11G0010230 [Takifugu flavidus]